MPFGMIVPTESVASDITLRLSETEGIGELRANLKAVDAGLRRSASSFPSWNRRASTLDHGVDFFT